MNFDFDIETEIIAAFEDMPEGDAFLRRAAKMVRGGNYLKQQFIMSSSYGPGQHFLMKLSDAYDWSRLGKYARDTYWDSDEEDEDNADGG